MAGGSLDFIVDSRRGKLLTAFNSTKEAIPPKFYLGDTVPVSVRLVEDSGDPDVPWADVDMTGKTVKVDIGAPASIPTGGTFTFTYGGNTTSALAYNASAATVQTALNALASITSAGGVTVTSSLNAYQITFNSAGTRTALTSNSASLTPGSEIQISTNRAGTVSVAAIYIARLKAIPAASATLAPEEADFVTITTIQEGATGTTSDLQEITISPLVYGGTYTLAIGADITLPLAYNATATQIRDAISDLPTDYGVPTVTGAHPVYRVNFSPALGDVDEMVADDTGLNIFKRISGTIDMTGLPFVSLLNGAKTVDSNMEVNVIDDATGNKWTPVQASCTIHADI